MSFDRVTSNLYMQLATPISLSCVQDGTPMIPFFKGKNIEFWGCGQCGICISKDNKKLPDLPYVQGDLKT